MGLFNNIINKKQQSFPRQLDQPLNDAPSSPRPTMMSKSSGSGNVPDLDLDWSKIYVEIDNDANLPNLAFSQSRSYTVAGGASSNGGSDDDSRSTASAAMTNDITQVNTGDASGVTDGDRTMEEDDDQDGTTRVMNAQSFRTAATSKDDSQGAFTITNNGKYLTTNDFANGQLMRWKFAAEEGPTYVQMLAFLAALMALGSTLYPIVTEVSYPTIPVIICAFHTTILCVIIMIFELRAFGARNPMNVRARARTLLTRYLNILRLLWGRGCLYIFTGSMNITVYNTYTLYTGLALVALGCTAILVGAHASFNLERLKLSLTDHSFLWSKFEAADSDRDDLIGIAEFSNLVWSLGLEIDDAYTYRAFSQIDRDSDSRINFQEFKSWWIAVQEDAPLPQQINV